MSVYTVDIIMLVITVVVSAGLLAIRSRFTGSAMRDFLGITAAFIILSFVTFQMIVGEYALG